MIGGRDYEIFQHELRIYKDYRKMTYPSIPHIDDDDFDEQLQKISASDADLQQQLALLMYPMGRSERMALGLNAYISIDESHTQLCELRPKHGDYSPEMLRGIFLIQQLSPQAKAEFATDLLMEDWEFPSTIDDAPSTIIE